MTGSVAAAPSAAVMSSLTAVGAQRAAWLLLAFPVAGAVILLLGGKRSNSWGHLVGVAMPVASFVYASSTASRSMKRPFCFWICAITGRK